ncbi:MAG: hypothetical protein RMX96_01915 [Nostoc sp. ChiSLP02]|nr:hypothetical protein [Nostoc sp. DedSLP01]MDZ8183605.1 hypothetical protein [Nostoc sp. ChiSLP02]
MVRSETQQASGNVGFPFGKPPPSATFLKRHLLPYPAGTLFSFGDANANEGMGTPRANKPGNLSNAVAPQPMPNQVFDAN